MPGERAQGPDSLIRPVPGERVGGGGRGDVGWGAQPSARTGVVQCTTGRAGVVDLGTSQGRWGRLRRCALCSGAPQRPSAPGTSPGGSLRRFLGGARGGAPQLSQAGQRPGTRLGRCWDAPWTSQERPRGGTAPVPDLGRRQGCLDGVVRQRLRGGETTGSLSHVVCPLISRITGLPVRQRRPWGRVGGFLGRGETTRHHRPRRGRQEGRARRRPGRLAGPWALLGLYRLRRTFWLMVCSLGETNSRYSTATPSVSR